MIRPEDRSPSLRWYYDNRKKMLAYMTDRQRRGIDFVQRWKMAAGCFDCGFAGHPAALHFDHVRGEKVSNVGTMYGRAHAVLIREIEKCVVRCANCHAAVTVERRP